MPGGSLYTAAQLAASALAGDPRREESFETKPEYRAYQDEWFMTVTMGEHLPPTGDANRSKRWTATRRQRAKIEDQRARLPWTVDATDDRWYNTTLHAAAAAAAAGSAPGAEEAAAHERDLRLPPGPVDSGMPAVRITLANAADYPPPSLRAYRTDALVTLSLVTLSCRGKQKIDLFRAAKPLEFTPRGLHLSELDVPEARWAGAVILRWRRGGGQVLGVIDRVFDRCLRPCVMVVRLEMRNVRLMG